MDGIHVHISLGLTSLMLWSSPVNSDIPTTYLCHDAKITTHHVELNMNTYVIAGTTGLCQCKVMFIMDASFNMTFHDITSPQCDTEISLSDGSFQPTCQGDTIQFMPYSKQFKTGGGLTIQAKAKGNFQGSMSGTIQMRTSDNTNFTLECFKTEVTKTAMTSTATTTTLTTSMLSSSKSISTLTTTAASANRGVTHTTGVTTQSNANLKVVTKKEFPVILTVGCAAGGVVLIALVVFGVVMCRRKKNPNQKAAMRHDTVVNKDESRWRDDDFISMENELYCSSGDIPKCSKNEPSNHAGNERGEEKTDPYAIVDKSRNAGVPPISKLNRRAAPSGDVYTIVDENPNEL